MTYKELADKNVEILGVDRFKQMQCHNENISWSHSIVSDLLLLPNNKPNICKIVKFFTKCEIGTRDIIDTCCSRIPNQDGLNLTGKKMLINGFIIQNLVYYTDSTLSSLQVCKFKIPFCSSIILSNYLDESSFAYCIKPTIEDIYINCINNRLVYSSISLFLSLSKDSI